MRVLPEHGLLEVVEDTDHAAGGVVGHEIDVPGDNAEVRNGLRAGVIFCRPPRVFGRERLHAEVADDIVVHGPSAVDVFVVV